MKEKFKKNKFSFIILILFILFIPIALVIATNYKTFLVEKVFGYDELLITDGFSQYIISYGFGCSSFDFSEGETILIDTYFSPSFFDTILVEGIFDTKTCDITDSEEVNLKKYFVVSVIDGKDEIIVEDQYGDKYIVEYGIGCLSMWRYEDKYIDIDIGGSFLDGIGDRIYLFDSNDDCKVWDVQEISSESWGGSPFSLLQCPANSTLIGNQCICNEGYTSYNNECITYTEKCKISYGENVYGKKEGDKLFCYCKNGYEWNSTQTACVKSIICPLNSQKINNVCVCNEGYIMRDNECITYTEDCTQHFGSNVYGVKGDTDNSSCYCKGGYEWNLSRTACIKKEEKKPSTIEKQEFQKEEEHEDEEKIVEKESKETKIAGKDEEIGGREGYKKRTFLESISLFLANILNALKNILTSIKVFFSRIFQ